jgi:hypothetical protein
MAYDAWSALTGLCRRKSAARHGFVFCRIAPSFQALGCKIAELKRWKCLRFIKAQQRVTSKNDSTNLKKRAHSTHSSSQTEHLQW